MNKPELLIVHHTGGTDANPLADTSHHTAAQIKQWHLAKGWVDIGYHWVIEKDGKLVKGRGEDREGAHTVGYNTKSIGLCFSGNFDATMPTEAQIASFKAFYKGLMTRYPHLTPDRVVPHRKYANKTCYGNKLADNWASNLATQALQATPPNPPQSTTTLNSIADRLELLVKELRKVA